MPSRGARGRCFVTAAAPRGAQQNFTSRGCGRRQQPRSGGVEVRRSTRSIDRPNNQEHLMNRTTFIACLLLGSGAAAFAQSPAGTVQRDINQEKRIEQGLQSGALSTREAATLQREESRVNRMQSRALKDGQLSAGEQAKLSAAQNKVSADIRAAKHNGVTGNPQSASSQRMQADVQRNINQQQRIEAGVRNGSLTNKEVARLERGQARVTHAEAAAGRNGHVGAAEQARVQQAENHQSRRIARQKHDAQQKN
jgi:hypothetical protein